MNAQNSNNKQQNQQTTQTEMKQTGQWSQALQKAKKNRYSRGIALFLVALLVGSATVSAAGFFGRRAFKKRMIGKIIGKLKLSKDQKAKLRTIYKEAKQGRMVAKQQRKAHIMKIAQVLQQEKPSKQQLDKLISQGLDKVKAKALSKTTYLLQALHVLNPKQKKILFSELKQIKQMVQKFHKKRMKNHSPDQIPFFLR